MTGKALATRKVAQMAQHLSNSCKQARHPVFSHIFLCLPYISFMVFALVVLSACRVNVEVEWFDPTPLPPRPIPRPRSIPQLIPSPVLPLTATDGLSGTIVLAPTAVASGLPALQTFPSCLTLIPVAYPAPGAIWCEPPPSVSIKHHRMYTKGANRYIIGEIANDWTTPLYWLTITATCYDADNHIIARQQTATIFDKSVTGQINPFKLTISNAPTGIARYELTLSGSPTNSQDYSNVTVVSHTVRDNGGTEIVGELQNDQVYEIDGIKVVGVFYDSAGNVLDITLGERYRGRLEPTDRTPYTISPLRTVPYSTYVVLSQGVRMP
jgi:hypothetical protein